MYLLRRITQVNNGKRRSRATEKTWRGLCLEEAIIFLRCRKLKFVSDEP